MLAKADHSLQVGDTSLEAHALPAQFRRILQANLQSESTLHSISSRCMRATACSAP